jgi:hypothetical protein
MIFEVRKGGAEPIQSDWDPSELELEKYLISRAEGESNAALLDAKVFGEPLLLLKNQVSTKQHKRADIVALDEYGNGVFVELKRRQGVQGIETQALQYLANYSNLKGRRFLDYFGAKEAIDSFLGDYDPQLLNAKSRIMLVARSFDDSVLSMGEWLASQGVAFRCIEYTPFEVGGRRFLTFSVRFDRSKDPLYQLSWDPSRAPQYFWHNIGLGSHATTGETGDLLERWWAHHLRQKMISASFNNERGDAGDKLLNSYVAKDSIIAYASGFGAIGWGVVDLPAYELVGRGHDEFSEGGKQLHRLGGVKWKNAVNSLKDAIGPRELKEKFGLSHPIQTKARIRREQAEGLISEMKNRFKAVP